MRRMRASGLIVALLLICEIATVGATIESTHNQRRDLEETFGAIPVPGKEWIAEKLGTALGTVVRFTLPKGLEMTLTKHNYCFHDFLHGMLMSTASLIVDSTTAIVQAVFLGNYLAVVNLIPKFVVAISEIVTLIPYFSYVVGGGKAISNACLGASSTLYRLFTEQQVRHDTLFELNRLERVSEDSLARSASFLLKSRDMWLDAIKSFTDATKSYFRKFDNRVNDVREMNEYLLGAVCMEAVERAMVEYGRERKRELLQNLQAHKKSVPAQSIESLTVSQLLNDYPSLHNAMINGVKNSLHHASDLERSILHESSALTRMLAEFQQSSTVDRSMCEFEEADWMFNDKSGEVIGALRDEKRMLKEQVTVFKQRLADVVVVLTTGEGASVLAEGSKVSGIARLLTGVLEETVTNIAAYRNSLDQALDSLLEDLSALAARFEGDGKGSRSLKYVQKLHALAEAVRTLQHKVLEKAKEFLSKNFSVGNKSSNLRSLQALADSAKSNLEGAQSGVAGLLAVVDPFARLQLHSQGLAVYAKEHEVFGKCGSAFGVARVTRAVRAGAKTSATQVCQGPSFFGSQKGVDWFVMVKDGSCFNSKAPSPRSTTRATMRPRFRTSHELGDQAVAHSLKCYVLGGFQLRDAVDPVTGSILRTTVLSIQSIQSRTATLKSIVSRPGVYLLGYENRAAGHVSHVPGCGQGDHCVYIVRTASKKRRNIEELDADGKDYETVTVASESADEGLMWFCAFLKHGIEHYGAKFHIAHTDSSRLMNIRCDEETNLPSLSDAEIQAARSHSVEQILMDEGRKREARIQDEISGAAERVLKKREEVFGDVL